MAKQFVPPQLAAVVHSQTGSSLPNFDWVKFVFLFFICVATLSLHTLAEDGVECAATLPYVSSAQKELASGDSAAALQELERTVALYPNCADPYLLLGLTEFQVGDTSKSIEHLKHAVRLAPRSYSGHYNLALAYLKRNNLSDARRELERALALGPNEANAAYDLGIVLLQLHEPAAALPYLRRVHATEPERGDASFNIVRAQLETGQIAQARKTAQQDAVRFKSDSQWNAAVGQLFFKNAQPEDALVYLRAAYGMRPESDELRAQLASAYLACKRPADVLALINAPQGPEEHYLHGSALYSLRRFNEADEDSLAALAQAPQDPKTLILRVRLLQRAGEQNVALDLAKRAASLVPNWDVPFYLAGISNYFLRRYSDARQDLARAFELNPRSAAAIFLEGLAWASEGKASEAETALRRAISLDPQNGRFQCHLGILLMREYRQAEAEKLFRQAVQLKPGYALPYYELAKFEQQSNHLQVAAQDFEKVIALDPGFTSAYYQLARVYTRLGDSKKSQQMLLQFQKRRQQESDESEATESDARQQAETE